MAVLTIFLAAAIPAVFKRVDRGAWTKEVNDMGAISNALTLQILRGYAIPSETNWHIAVGNWTMRTPSQIRTNSRGFARLFFYDQGGWLNGNLPYTQLQGGTAAGVPASARIAIVSTIAGAARNWPFANGGLSTANFNTIWNATQETVPSYLSGLGWNGRGEDLVIQRIPVDRLFHHLILSTRDDPGTAGFSINSTTVRSDVPSNAAGTNTYYLDGTVVGLWVGATLTNRFLLTRDMSLTFEVGTWRDQLTGSGSDNSITAQDFANQARIFIQTAQIPGGHQGADTQGVLSAFYSFMYSYTLWANKCPHFQYSGNNGNQAVDYLILNTLGQNGSGGIINGTSGTGGGGLLQ